MSETFDDLPGWTFEIEEITNGIWSVSGSDTQGHSVSIKGGTDPDAMLADLKERARRIASTIPN